MEQFSVLKTPGYPKYHGNISTPTYSDGHGYSYTRTYYEPIYDLDLKIPGLGIAQLPFVPIQHIRSQKGRRPFVPRHLTEEDMIQINLRAAGRARDIMKDFHPAQKASYESARDFRTRKEIESRIEEIRESCANANSYYKKAGQYDFTRKGLVSSRPKGRLTCRNYGKDVILDAKVENVDDIKKKLVVDKANHRENFKIHAAGCVRKSDEVKQNQDQDLEEDETEVPSTERRTSRETRAEQLKVLQERIKKQETESDCFERTFGRHLSKLRGEVNSLTHVADDYIADSKYQTFKIDQIFRRN